MELLIDRVVVSNEEVKIRYVVPTTKASEQVYFSHSRAAYRARRQRDPEEMASDAVLALLPYGRADAGRA